MEIFSSSNPEVHAGKALSALLKASNDRSVLLLVSGGSAFKLLEFVETNALSVRCTLGVLDERYSHEPTINNFSQLMQLSFYRNALMQGVMTIDTRLQKNETMEEMQERWDANLHEWVEHNPEGIVVVTMGVGKDGHTAGIFPSSDVSLFENDAWTSGYEVLKEVNPYMKRFTVTYTFLRVAVTHALVFVVGEDKEKALQAVLRDTSTLQETPASILRELSSVVVYTDREMSFFA